MGTAQEPLTLGAEEEYQLLDARTGALVSVADAVLEQLDGDVYEHELQRSMVETHSGVHERLADLRADLAARRRALRAAAENQGAWLVASGTVPLSDWRDQSITSQPRYERMSREHGRVASEQIVCGCHVHVGVPDRATGLRAMRHVVPWLPVLLALSTSSPYWQCRDTGYCSYRTQVWSRWPTAGFPPEFAGPEDYAELTQRLLRTGTVLDAAQLYWYVRPSEDFPTLEFRIADSCTRLDETVLQAALCRGLVATALERDATGVPPPAAHPTLLEAAAWRAARSGLGDLLVDPVAGDARPARELVEALLEDVGPALERHGDHEAARDLLDDLLTGGTSAHRQREAVARRGRLEDGVTRLVRETDPDFR
ncbi:glutamate--cysteine ligase [Egicoccus sp. AB-alg2]|uniref:carboxylate-amine ligase n=1 Tax=Egicoccus sp. AB-alg2 TaxID=3242693 RepID=UPI00359CEBCA